MTTKASIAVLWLGVFKKHGRIHYYEWHGLYPVSYTHLRAHETGRNLVCRLLLEIQANLISVVCSENQSLRGLNVVSL